MSPNILHQPAFDCVLPHTTRSVWIEIRKIVWFFGLSRFVRMKLNSHRLCPFFSHSCFSNILFFLFVAFSRQLVFVSFLLFLALVFSFSIKVILFQQFFHTLVKTIPTDTILYLFVCSWIERSERWSMFMKDRCYIPK